MLLLSRKPLLTYLTTTALWQSSRALVSVHPKQSSFSRTTRLPMSTTTTSTSNPPLAIVVHAEIDPTRLDEFVPLIQHNAEQSRQEPGCHRFDVLRDPSASNQFIFYELYATAEDIEYHKQQAHYQAWADFKASGGTVSSVTYKHVGESVVL